MVERIAPAALRRKHRWRTASPDSDLTTIGGHIIDAGSGTIDSLVPIACEAVKLC